MHILIGGGSGFIGSALTKRFRQRGDMVTCISRTAGPGRITWNDIDNGYVCRWFRLLGRRRDDAVNARGRRRRYRDFSRQRFLVAADPCDLHCRPRSPGQGALHRSRLPSPDGTGFDPRSTGRTGGRRGERTQLEPCYRSSAFIGIVNAAPPRVADAVEIMRPGNAAAQNKDRVRPREALSVRTPGSLREAVMFFAPNRSFRLAWIRRWETVRPAPSEVATA